VTSRRSIASAVRERREGPDQDKITDEHRGYHTSVSDFSWDRQTSGPTDGWNSPIAIEQLLSSAREQDQIAVRIANNEGPGTPGFSLERLRECDARGLVLKE
jgi:hypothetical protein